MVVIQTLVFRSDGLPLSASTDIGNRTSVKECQKFIKLISKRLHKLPERCMLELEEFNIHVKSYNGISVLMLCDDFYPPVLCSCCLDEVERDFLDRYDAKRIANVKRPYAFIEYDTALQKIKQKYNNPKSLTTRTNLSVISNELRLRPPYQITEYDLDLAENEFLRPCRDSNRPTVNPQRRLVPLNWLGMLSIALNLFAAALNLIRGMAIISHGRFDEHDAWAYGHGSAFLLLSVIFCGQANDAIFKSILRNRVKHRMLKMFLQPHLLTSVQYSVYLMLFFSPWRHLQTALLLIAQCCCSYYVLSFRNVVQTTFFLAVTLFATVVIITRRQTSKLPGYSV